MYVYLEILSCPDTSLDGARFKVVKDLKIGRKQGEIRIPDSKISSLHAQVDVNDQGRYVLVDLGSSNGLLINDHKVKKISLISNVTFSIGRTSFRVLELAQNIDSGVFQFLTWQERLKENLKMALKDVNFETEPQNEDTIGEGAPKLVETQVGVYQQEALGFTKAVHLKFLEGIQADQEVLLGYGPRRAGFYHFDITLKEPGCPEELFEIRPTQNHAELINFESNFLLLNQQPIKKALLNTGDIIQFGKTKIIVEISEV